MSAELMVKAFEISASDDRLTPADKLVLLRWAWKTRDAATPYEIKFRTVARELGLSRNGVKACVRRLTEYGYLMAVSVNVVAGAVFQTGHAVTPADNGKGGHAVTPDGSRSDPQKGRTVTPIKKKREKKGPAALNFLELGRYQRACLRSGNGVIVAGQYLRPDDAEFRRLAELLRNEVSL